MNLENERIPSSVNAPDSYHKEFESRLLQRLGISADILITSTTDGNEAVITPEVNVVPANNKNELPLAELNPVTPQVEAQKIARKQEPETIKSEAVRKEIEEIGKINIEPMVVSTNENPEWVNFAAAESDSGASTEGIIKKSTTKSESDNIISNNSDLVNTGIDSSNNNNDGSAEEITLSEVDSEVPDWNDIVSVSNLDTEAIPALKVEATKEDKDNVIQSDTTPTQTDAVPSIVVHHVPESLIPETSPYESAAKLDDAPKETVLYNQSEPGLDTLEPPPAPFAPIAGRVQNTSNSPGWIGIAASVAAIVAAYFIWVAIQPSAEEKEPVVAKAPEVVTTPAVTAAPKDTVPAGIRLVENLILDEKLEKYKEPNVFSVDKLDDLPEKSKKALNDLEHHNIAVFDMEDVLFEDLDLLIQ